MSAIRADLTSALAGRYTIERELGRGGMATVYRARDIKHERDVAIKVLDPELGAVLGGDRFLSEIRVTANLQHPNLLPLFDSGSADGLLYYVMPFVEGETLRARLDREKQLPIDDAIRIAVAVANALAYAHERGVIHRDLKPENILLHAGQPVVADFGIALAVSNAGGQRVTQTGLSLGTPQYMSPEQATGDRAIDGRTDVYSLGAVTYEMLTGEPPHTGSSAQAVIARVMTEDPRPIAHVRRTVPPNIEAAVHRALEKLPADRFATARDFSDALQGRIAVATRPVPHTTIGRRWPSIAVEAGLGLAAIALAAGWWRAAHKPPPPRLRFVLDQPDGANVADFGGGLSVAVSNDGQTVAYLAGISRRLYVRRLDRLTPNSYVKAQGFDIHFSEDGKSVAFLNNGIRRIAVGTSDETAEPIQITGALSNWTGLSWEHGHDVVWTASDSLWRQAPNGKQPILVAGKDSTDGSWNTPVLLRGGEMVAVRVTPRGSFGGTPSDRLGLVSIHGGKRTLVDIPFQNAIGYANGVLVFGESGGRIAAVKLDLASGKLSSEPVTIAENVAFKPSGGVMASMGDDGTLAYLVGAPQSLQQIVNEKGVVVDSFPAPSSFVSPSWSPDGTRIAVGMGDGANPPDVWVYDLRSRVLTRVATDGIRTAWTSDGKRIAFISSFLIRGMGSGGDAMWVAADGSSPAEAIPAAKGFPTRQIAFSADGKWLVLQAIPARGSDQSARAFAFPLAGGEPVALMPGVVDVAEPAISPNGKWISYTSTETGRPEIAVRPFPTGSGKVQISTNGGWEARWSRDGTKLFYRTSSAVRAATLDITGAMPRLVRSDSLFPDTWVSNSGAFSWDVSGDGKRFLLRREIGGARIVVEKNWLPEVVAKLGATR